MRARRREAPSSSNRSGAFSVNTDIPERKPPRSGSKLPGREENALNTHATRLTAFFLVATVALVAPAAQAQILVPDGSVAPETIAAARRSGQQNVSSGRYELTLDDAIERALERNLDIAVQRINPLVQDMAVVTANAAFLPLASSGFGLNQSTFPNRTLFDGGGLTGRSIVTDRGNYDVGIDQAVKWGGGQYSVTWDSSRSESTNIFNSFNPSYAANMSLTYTQPLLRGFRTDQRRTQLAVSRIGRDISDIDLEQTIINTLADVQSRYWDLVYANASVAVQEQALALAEQLVRDNQVRVEIGTLAPIDVVQAESEAAARRQALAQAIQVLRTAELALKQLIVGGTSDELWSIGLFPIDEPQVATSPIDLEGAVASALERRTDIERVRRQLDINDANVDNLRNSTLPALDVVGNYQLTGQGGPRLVRDNIFGGNVTTEIPGGYGDAVSSIAGNDYPFWSVALQMSYPLGRSADKAAYERARLQVQQTTAQIRQIELQIASEITNAALQIDAIQGRIEAATAARELAEEQLRAEESRFEVGLSTNFFVVQAQRDLATAQDNELRAILDFQLALIEFERAQRSSLGAAGVTVIGGGG
ncbi:MAG: TolC family protein [Acidobacteria bacterium]|nr:TolC family protein [Acidobacteriota bacterium]MYD69944.1 TolC family protein [Acidobacteriota bacterium]MYJ05337.1 TolC family protein [Acidobacteriota bacterium]